MIKKTWAALANITKSGLEKLQAGPRSSSAYAMNYNSVTTLDPTRLARAFSMADDGHITDQATLFELIEEQDTHIFSELSKRRRAVTGLSWQLAPPEDATESEIARTKELEGMLRSISNIEDAQYDLTDAAGKGFSALEIDWKKGAEWLPKSFIWVPQRAFQVDKQTGQLQLLVNGMPEALRPYGWITHVHRAKSGYIENAALFRVLAWTYAYKAYNTRDMQRFLEVYGLPLRLGKYPAGISGEQRNELLKAVRNIGNDGAGVVPSTMTIDFVNAAAGKVDDFLSAIEYWERKQSLAILGGTLTSQADGKTSTNALGEIHNKVRREIMLHDVAQIQPTCTNQIVRPIAILNGMFPADRLPVWMYNTEETVNQKEMVEVLQKAVDIGMEIDLEYAHKVMQIPRSEDKKEILKKAGKAPTDAAALTRLAALANQDQDVRAAYAAQLAALCAPHEQKLIQDILAAVDQAEDYDAAITAIEALTINYDKSAWAESLALGLAAAHLAGRSEVDGQ